MHEKGGLRTPGCNCGAQNIDAKNRQRPKMNNPVEHPTGIPEFVELANKMLATFQVLHELCQTDLTDTERRAGLDHVVDGMERLGAYCRKCSVSLREQSARLN